MQSLILDISPLIDKPTGTRETYSFEVPLEFEDMTLTENTTGKIELMKIDEGFNAKVTEVKVSMDFKCDKCLKKIKQDVFVDMAERQFLMDRPAEVRDENDLYLVQRKDLTIDLGEFLRQEIILHFPSIPVCSKSCKGLCPVCGKDRNETTCNCREEKIEEEKPLAILKQLLKNK